ncbi:MAG: M48 family metallopeptidase [Cyclobacteriaceae bacterium]|nr:M48 family metallopeptidase [Cyclobacteriaceae bacterium]
MQSKTLRDILVLLTIGAALFAGGYFLVREISKSDYDLSYEVSMEQEEELGNLFKDLIWDKYPTVKENYADTALQQIAKRLVNALDSTQYRYQFTIIKSKEINAFTIPGGNIYVFSGLLELAETPEEVAAVLAHEIGHAEKRHVVTRLINEMSLSAVIAVLSGGDPSVLTQMLQSVISNRFSRENEDEADKFALQLLEDAHISPKSMAKFFQKLNDKNLDYNEDLEFMMTHPHSNKRIDRARKYKTRNNFSAEPFSIDWEKVQKSLNAE